MYPIVSSHKACSFVVSFVSAQFTHTGEPARTFVLAGFNYRACPPSDANIHSIDHISPPCCSPRSFSSFWSRVWLVAEPATHALDLLGSSCARRYQNASGFYSNPFPSPSPTSSLPPGISKRIYLVSTAIPFPLHPSPARTLHFRSAIITNRPAFSSTARCVAPPLQRSLP